MLTSINNPKVKEWKKLHKRKFRERMGCFIIEGDHLVEEALRSGWKIEELMVREDYTFTMPEEVPWTEVSTQVFDAIAQTETPQGIAAVVSIEEKKYKPSQLSLLIDGVQDPGNLGTLIRTADAAGFEQVILGNGTVDAFNEKVVRATQGSIFHIPVVRGDLEGIVRELQTSGVKVFASSLTNAVSYKEIATPRQVALIIGNEGNGVREELIELADEQIYIPIYGQAESLNAAIAGAVLMYHLRG